MVSANGFCVGFRFVLLQMAAAKLLGMLIPRIVTHNLYSETPGGWVLPKHYYVTIITGYGRDGDTLLSLSSSGDDVTTFL